MGKRGAEETHDCRWCHRVFVLTGMVRTRLPSGRPIIYCQGCWELLRADSRRTRTSMQRLLVERHGRR